MNILNLTQHQPTISQKEAGVFCLANETELHHLLTFETTPDATEIHRRAETIARLALSVNAKYALLGGALFLMSALEKALLMHNITPLYSFSVRQTKEEKLPDGSVKKLQIFNHIEFINNQL